MQLTLSDLRARLNPARTVLLMGAGAAVPSGAPSGASLAEILWREVAKKPSQSDDLIETATFLERRYDRRSVIDSVVKTLKPLRPTGGLLALPHFGWSMVFSTNFDQLVETAYRLASIPLTAFRSNFDFTNRDGTGTTPLYKIHGCITQDRSLGDQSSMVLTEGDYETFKQYKQTLFSKLSDALYTHDVLIIGQSLRDKHLAEMIKEVLSLRREGIRSQVYALIYDPDDLRAPLLEDRGAALAFGGIDEFVAEMASAAKTVAPVARPVGSFSLPLELTSVTHDVADEIGFAPNTKRMFNGGPATYADIQSGATFERSVFEQVREVIKQNTSKVIAIVGAAGVGKTSFARQLLVAGHNLNLRCWEHKADFPLRYKHWLDVNAQLVEAGERGLLLVDECTHYLRAVNQLVDALSSIEQPALQVVVTANAAQWTPRIKSPGFFTTGAIYNFSRLVDSEVHSLINLVDQNPTIAGLVHKSFRDLRRDERFATLKRRASADMFVCLNNIFATENLDIILLEEYEALDPDLKDYYRYVAALEAVGARVHRQLIVRMLNLRADKVSLLLDRLQGIIDEYDISAKDGIFGWHTRHLVIARKITEYKFSAADELEALFKSVIENLNPANKVELHSVRDLCDVDYGIGRLGDSAVKLQLYRRLIDVAPAERVPWHRLISELLRAGELNDVEHELRNAELAAGSDAPLDRYKVRLLVARAKQPAKIAESDRVALLRRAYERAIANVDRHRFDKMSYYTLCEVALELVEKGESEYLVEEAVGKLRSAAEFIHDPEILERVRMYDRRGHLRR